MSMTGAVSGNRSIASDTDFAASVKLAFTAGPTAWLAKTGRPCLTVMWLVLSVVAVIVIFELA